VQMQSSDGEGAYLHHSAFCEAGTIVLDRYPVSDVTMIPECQM
jgi:hypothetical protein